jgi:hypothetical protein
MKTNHLTVMALVSVALCSTAAADWPVDFVRITCIPEADYLAFDSATIYRDQVLNGVENWSNESNVKKRMRRWEEAGYYDPTNLKYECRLSSAAYTLIVKQAPSGGHCNAPGTVTLSLQRDGVKVISEVVFGSSGEPLCPTGATLEKAMADGGTLQLLKISRDSKSPSIYKWLLSNEETKTTITPAILVKYAKEAP